MRPANYDKYPATRTEGGLFRGWTAIRKELDRTRKGPLAVDWYTGVHEEELAAAMEAEGYREILRESTDLLNGKKLMRMDFGKAE